MNFKLIHCEADPPLAEMFFNMKSPNLGRNIFMENQQEKGGSLTNPILSLVEYNNSPG